MSYFKNFLIDDADDSVLRQLINNVNHLGYSTSADPSPT